MGCGLVAVMPGDDEIAGRDEAGQPIEGVYVVGNDQGGFFGTVYPETFGGVCNGRSMTFGYLVGKELAQA